MALPNRIGRPCEHRRFSVAEAWLVNEPSQPQGWRLLSKLPAAIYSGRRSGLVVQHAAGIDSCDRRNSLVFVDNKRDRVLLELAEAAPCGHGTRKRDGRYSYSIWP